MPSASRNASAFKEPFLKIPVAVLKDRAARKISPSAFVVYAALRRFFNRGTLSCFPSWKKLLETAGVSRSTLNSELTMLEHRGWIMRKQVKKDSTRTSTRYRFPPAIEECPFIAIPIPLLQDVASRKVTPSAFVAYAALRHFADRKTNIAWPDYDELRGAAGFSGQTISDALKNLLATGWIERQKRGGASPQYTVLGNPLEIEPQSSKNRTSEFQKSDPNQNQGTKTNADHGKERREPSTPSEVGGAPSANKKRATPPKWDEVRFYGKERRYPEETVTKFWMLNQENGWTTSRGNPIRHWRTALDAFAKTDRARLDPQLPGDPIKRLWAFVRDYDFGEYDGVYLANRWIDIMEKRDWKIPDPLTRTPVPVRDHIKTFLAWYENVVLDEDRQRTKWGDIDEDELYGCSGVATGAGGEEDEVF